MKRLYFFVVALLVGHSLLAQVVNVSWANRIGSSSDDLLQILTIDGSGNVYIAGSFSGTVDFDPSPTTTFNLTSAGGGDAFFAKYSSAGVLIWANKLGSTGEDEAYGIAVDASGNVYVAGYFTGTVDFNPDAVTVTNRTSAGFEDAFFGKYSSAGGLNWVNPVGSSAFDDYAYGIAVDASGNVYVTGVFAGTADFDPTGTVLNKTSVGGNDAFFARYLSTGGLSWVNQLGSSGTEFVGTVSVSGNFAWIGGSYGGNMNLNPNGSSTSTGSVSGGIDGFFAEYATTSGLATGAWGSVQSTGDDRVRAVNYDGTTLTTAGTFTGSATVFGASTTGVVLTSAGGTDGFFAKHTTASMSLAFAKGFGGLTNDGVDHMVVDPSKANIYISGYYSGTADFNPDAAANELTALGSIDAFFAKYAYSNGALVYTNSMGASGDDEASCIAVDASNNIYVGGVFEGTADFAPGTPTTNLSSLGLWDGFFVKYAPGVSSTEPTAQPTNLVFSNQTGFGFDWSFTAATGAPEGYLGVYKIGSAPTGVPTDGVEYDYNDPIGDGIVLWSSASTTGWTWSGAAASSNYHIAIFSYNGTGSARNYRTVSPLINNTTTLTQAAQPSAAPTAFSVTNVSGSGFTISYTASTGGATGYVAFRKAGSAPSITLNDGKTFTVGNTVTDGSVVAYVGSNTTFTQTGLLSDTDYYYAIYAYNGASTATNYLGTALTGLATTAEQDDDFTSPVIVNNTATVTPPNTAVVIKLAVTDSESGVGDIEVHYYPINSYDYGEGFAIKTTGNNYEYSIPASFVREQGVEYEVIAYDLVGNPAYINFTQVAVEHTGNGLAIPYSSPGSAATNYRIVAVPLDLTKKSVNDVFADDLGAADKSKWRVFHYSGGSTKEHSGSIELGKGYWLISSEQKTINSGPGTTADIGIGKPFVISLSNGWNQIGNPFNFNIAWADVVGDTDNEDIEIGDLRLFGGTWTKGTTLPRMTGGFVMATGAGQLSIPLIKTARTAPKPKPNFAQPLDSDTWAVDIKLASGDLVNDFGGIGMHPSAKDIHDRYDDYTLPRFFDYLELNHNKKLHGSPFTRDIVPTANEHTWTFDVESNGSNEVVQLSWDNTNFGDNEFQLVLWDELEQRAVDMRTHNAYAFKRGKSNAFKVYFGSSDYIARHTKPTRAVFHSASPVPATDRITFAFSIPETAGKTPTSLDVYNLTGQRVARLIQESLPGGYHEAVWMIEEGRKPAGGVYISVLKFGESVAQKRIVIK